MRGGREWLIFEAKCIGRAKRGEGPTCGPAKKEGEILARFKPRETSKIPWGALALETLEAKRESKARMSHNHWAAVSRGFRHDQREWVSIERGVSGAQRGNELYGVGKFRCEERAKD